MLNLFLFISIVFLFTFLVGRLIEKIRVPWVFAALILGAILAFYNPFQEITSSKTFEFLALLGMYFLLFIIGLEIDLKEIRKKSKFIFKSTFFIILLEALFGSLLIHYVFNYGWTISILVALSFATVGEAILIPILDEFKIINTKLGQTIIGIGVTDNIIEILTLVALVALIAPAQASHNLILIIGSLIVLFVLAAALTKLKKQGRKFNYLNIETLFIFSIFILFLFLGIGEYAESGALAALLSGAALKTFIPKNRLKLITSEVRTMSYGFFVPIFFLWVGASMDINYLFKYPLLILLVVIVSKGSKLLGSYLIAHKELGKKESILLGIGLSVRFSTSIIIIKILFEKGLIGTDLYSVIVASTIAFKFIVPALFANLLVKWKVKNRA
jgi:Ca2+-transporting ATPase